MDDPCKNCHNLEQRDRYLALLETEFNIVQKRYEVLYEISPLGLFQMRISDKKLIKCNRTLVDILGYNDKEECLNKGILASIKPEDQKRFESLLENKKQIQGFRSAVKVDNAITWVEINAELFEKQDLIEGVMKDITPSKILTSIELNILDLLLKGSSNKEIAKVSHRSIRTIEDHRSRIMRKLNVDNLVALTRKVLFLERQG